LIVTQQQLEFKQRSVASGVAVAVAVAVAVIAIVIVSVLIVIFSPCAFSTWVMR
jgi:hypothetical protein